MNFFMAICWYSFDCLFIREQGTGIVIYYNLWEDGEGQLELDFGADINVVPSRTNKVI